MDINPVVLAIPLYFLLIGVELIWEARSRRGVYRVNDALTNLSCGISSQIMGAIWGVISIGLYQLIYQYASIAQIPVNWWSNILLFVLVDLMYYWYHRASHEINFLWNVSHVVHHQSEDYNLSVALRQASFGGIFSMTFYLPLAFLGFNTYAFIVVKGINLIYQFWIHTEAIDKLPRWFEYIFNTPSHHRVHHGRNPKYIDRNHAGTLMIWDRMFGTFQAEEEKPTYGVTKPIKTWNPVWANVLPMVDMGRQVWKTPGFGNKMKVLFYKPGWQPQELGGYQVAPEVIGREEKFSTLMPRGLNAYLIAQYLVLLGGTALFLFNHESFSLTSKLTSAGFIILTIVSFGMLMESRRTWNIIEIVRLTTLPILSLLFFPNLLIATIVTSVLFMTWFGLILKKNHGH